MTGRHRVRRMWWGKITNALRRLEEQPLEWYLLCVIAVCWVVVVLRITS